MRTQEEKRIAIAEACGWVRVESKYGSLAPKEFRVDSIGQPWTCMELLMPDYFGDLDAMHEAEKSLSYEDQIRFMVILCPILGLSGEGKYWYDLECHEAWKVSHATAEQRAEAFYRTIKGDE